MWKTETEAYDFIDFCRLFKIPDYIVLAYNRSQIKHWYLTPKKELMIFFVDGKECHEYQIDSIRKRD